MAYKWNWIMTEKERSKTMVVYGRDRGTANAGNKRLNRNKATSIMCSDVDVLKKSADLQIVASNNENEYYSIKNTNYVLMHVQGGFCVILDFKVQGIDVPLALSKMRFGVYQSKGRDWIRSTSEGYTIGYVIQSIVDANYVRICRENNMTIDHEAETFNELLCNCRFKNVNVNHGSHRRVIWLDSVKDLQVFVDRMRNYSSGFIYK